MLLRQYKRIRSLKKEKFNYRDIKDVYIIVFFEKSTSEFQEFSEKYLHYFSQQSDTRLEMDLLQKFLFVPLDIFRENQHNKVIRNKLDDWLLFLSSDAPEDILRLIDEYPEFRAMYEEAYQMCWNLEDVMGFFSEELRILDRNTTQYMMDEMQAEIDAKKKILESQQEQLEVQQEQLEKQQEQLVQKDLQLEKLKRRIAELEQNTSA